MFFFGNNKSFFCFNLAQNHFVFRISIFWYLNCIFFRFKLPFETYRINEMKLVPRNRYFLIEIIFCVSDVKLIELKILIIQTDCPFCVFVANRSTLELVDVRFWRLFYIYFWPEIGIPFLNYVVFIKTIFTKYFFLSKLRLLFLKTLITWNSHVLSIEKKIKPESLRTKTK